MNPLNCLLLQPQIQHFIQEHVKDDLTKLILKGSPFPGISARELATQVEGKRKAEKKLPTWFKSEKVLYPPKVNFEQTSSEITANYKSHLVGGKRLIDLTGGFGVDAFFFSKKMEEVVHCERNSDLSNLAKHNFRQLSEKQNIRFIPGDGLEFLQQHQNSFDWVYLDPSRRSDRGNKVFLLEDCEPDVISLLPLLLEKSDHILIKTSPLLDLHMGISSLKNVREIHIVAVSNEVKELLWVLSSESSIGEIQIKTVNFNGENSTTFEGSPSGERQLSAPYSEPLKILYEPNAALMKSGLFNTLATKLGISKLHPSSHLYTSESPVDFPGRVFKIIKVLFFKPKTLKREIGAEQANISTRNFPKTAAQLKKDLGIKDGGNLYLFFTTDRHEKKIVLVCEKYDPQ